MNTDKKVIKIGICIVFVIFFLNLILFTVGEKEVAIVTQFGKPIKTITEPGLNIKLPFPVQQVIRFDTRLLFFEPPASEFLTSDKKNILIESFMCWKITDPVKFLVTVNDRKGAESRLSDIMFSELGAALGRYPLSSLISTSSDEIMVDAIMKKMTEAGNEKTTKEYGVTIIDMALKKLDFPDQNKDSVFKRMKAERERIAQQYRSEGEEEAMKIKAGADMEKSRILSEAKETAQKTRGEADAEAIKIYAKAFNKNPNFYKFMRTLESYEKFLNEKTTIIMPENSDLLKFLNKTNP
jgi:membrane protease subunit HflC